MIIRTKSGLIRLYADGRAAAGTANDAAGEANTPRWNKLFPVGIVRYRGDFAEGINFDRAFLKAMVDNWVKSGRPHQHVNYDHEMGVAAGWIEDLELRDDGLYALIRWTAKAREHIVSDEYRFLSPEFSTDGLDKATGGFQGPTLYGCALLNDPYLEELPRVAASNNPNAAQAAGAQSMNWKAKLIAMLALAATATDEDVEKALETRQAKLGELEAQLANAQKEVTELKAKTEKLNLSESAVTKLASDLQASNAKVVELTNKVSAMEAKEKDSAIDAYLTEAVKAGRLPPAMREGVKAQALAMGLESVKQLWDKAPVTVPLGERGIRGSDSEDPQSALTKLRAAAEELAKKHGISLADAKIRAMELNPELARAAHGKA